MNSVPLSSNPELRNFSRQVFFPFVGLIAITLIALFGFEFWSAAQANKSAATASETLAQTGIRLALQQVGSNASATATWDDAVVHMHDRVDKEWAAENVGNWASGTLGFEMTFLVDPKGLTRYAMINGKTTDVSLQSSLGEGLDALLEHVRAAPFGEAATGIVRAGTQVALVGAAAVRPHTKNLPPISDGYSILVYADTLDGVAIAKLRQAYLLDDLNLLLAEPRGAEAVLPLLPSRGRPLAYLAWTPDQPGTRKLEVVLPALSALVIAIGVLSALVLIHARRAAAALLISRHQAMTDSLTGLPNRLLLEDHLQRAIQKGERVAALSLDLDGFKAVNDLHGHASGDGLLCEVARRLRAELRHDDIVARIGGDEFVIVQADLGEQAVADLARRLLTALAEPALILGTSVSVGVSLGIAFGEGLRETTADILRRSDIALYDAKRGGGNRFCIAAASSNAAEPCLEDQLDPRFTVAPQHH